MTMTDKLSPSPSSPRLDRWGWGIILFFLVIFAANAVLVVMGQRSWPGLVTVNHYQKGLAYNQVLQAQKQQDALNWTVTLQSDRLQAQRAGRVWLQVTDRDGQPVRGALVEGFLVRPVGGESDVQFVMQADEPGRYVTRITPPAPGVWDVKIRLLTKETGVDFRYVERITVSTNDQ